MRALVLAVLVLLLAPPALATPPASLHFDPQGHARNYQPANRGFYDVDTVVLHTGESDCYPCLVNYLRTNTAPVSAHFVADWSGELTQQVYEHEVAWHATYYNSRSVGIENVGHAHHDEWTRAQYHALAHLGAWLAEHYNIPLTHPSGDAYDYPNWRFDAPGFVAHSQVQPWNRSDPGPSFDWDYFMQLVRAYSLLHEQLGLPPSVVELLF